MGNADMSFKVASVRCGRRKTLSRDPPLLQKQLFSQCGAWCAPRCPPRSTLPSVPDVPMSEPAPNEPAMADMILRNTGAPIYALNRTFLGGRTRSR